MAEAPRRLGQGPSLLTCRPCPARLQAEYRAEKLSAFPHVDSPARLIRELVRPAPAAAARGGAAAGGKAQQTPPGAAAAEGKENAAAAMEA